MLENILVGIPWRRAVEIAGVDDVGILESDTSDENSNVFSRSVWPRRFLARTREMAVELRKAKRPEGYTSRCPDV